MRDRIQVRLAPLHILLLAMAPWVHAAGPPPALAQYRCTICHAERETLTGPSFADIAQAYQGRGDAPATIAAEIRAGIKSGGPWHMPPHPEVSPKEALEMARYILSVKPAEGEPATAAPQR
ncbi:MAG: cytochrome C [Burkholderiales bacterium]